MDFLNSKARKQFFQELQDIYDYTGPEDFVVFIGGRDKHYVISRGLEEIPFEQIRIKHAGLYIGSPSTSGFRLSLDGAQLFGVHCSNKIEVSGNQRDQWLMGKDIFVETDKPLTILTCSGDIIGCGPVQDGRVINHVPKARRIADPH